MGRRNVFMKPPCPCCVPWLTQRKLTGRTPWRKWCMHTIAHAVRQQGFLPTICYSVVQAQMPLRLIAELWKAVMLNARAREQKMKLFFVWRYSGCHGCSVYLQTLPWLKNTRLKSTLIVLIMALFYRLICWNCAFLFRILLGFGWKR